MDSRYNTPGGHSGKKSSGMKGNTGYEEIEERRLNPSRPRNGNAGMDTVDQLEFGTPRGGEEDIAMETFRAARSQ